ncbi:uncharacterized protein si:dkey-260g12.1 [Periophthalmus magnuspinnatus]|uniref:uncharacterized protein si:dkey-260g12.1 n=1 Tax=Periophthalmus magnuspinnatus TaxID=409849 RepID=UPI0024370B6E|nr:uncharacterized protein si:dkey-260g12.1 [Periophthalmus magnuspinnatus]
MRLAIRLLLWFMAVAVVLTSALRDTCRWKDQNCPKCGPGEYLKQCGCEPCPSGTYKSQRSCDKSCVRCFGDCKPGLHLKVVSNCSRTSDQSCVCEEGFHCVSRDRASGNCEKCRPSQTSTTTGPSRAWTPPCTSSKRSSELILGNTTNHETAETSKRLLVVLCPLLAVGGIALMLLFCLGCLGRETRFKQTVKKLCSGETKDTAHITRETTSETQQTVPMATANMGPVHVHNPGTVIFSLLSEFTGQIGEAKEEKPDVTRPSGDEEYCTVCQPVPSPTLPLSEEEHPVEEHPVEDMHSAFFPSQEQGKDSHVSMEEQL